MKAELVIRQFSETHIIIRNMVAIAMDTTQRQTQQRKCRGENLSTSGAKKDFRHAAMGVLPDGGAARGALTHTKFEG